MGGPARTDPARCRPSRGGARGRHRDRAGRGRPPRRGALPAKGRVARRERARAASAQHVPHDRGGLHHQPVRAGSPGRLRPTPRGGRGDAPRRHREPPGTPLGQRRASGVRRGARASRSQSSPLRKARGPQWPEDGAPLCGRVDSRRGRRARTAREGAPEAMTVLDWAIVALYFALSIGVGMKYTKKGGESLEEYFVAGRKAPWWLAGSAMIATTFAADTPLVVTGLVAAHGVAGNWLWWNFVISGMLTVFFYARLWRRAKVMTDVEFVEIRYGGRPATFLRGFRALYLALPINLIILGWVTLAMVKILQIALGIQPLWAVGLCFVVTVGYSAAAGMWAVLWTDLVQLVIKMTAVILLAWFAVK